MDSSKKRKAEENGTAVLAAIPELSVEDVRKIIDPFSQEQLLDILQEATAKHPDVLDLVRAIADRDPAQRKLFIRGLGWDTTTDNLRNLFSSYGELEEAVVILDKLTGKSKGYGFVTFKHIDGALRSLKEPSKKIDGRMTVTQLAASGTQPAPAAFDVSTRKIFVGNVPLDMQADRLLAHFSSFGEIEEGPLGFDKQTGKSRGFALFVYKNPEAAKASLEEATQSVDGHQVVVKLAADGRKVKPGGAIGAIPGVADASDIPTGLGYPPSVASGNSLSSQYGGPGLSHGLGGGVSSYGAFSGGHQSQTGISGGSLSHHLNSPGLSSVTPGLSSVSSQVPSSLGGSYVGGHSSGLGGQYGSSQYGGPGAGGYGALGSGSSLYRLPQSSVGGGPASGYPESGHYGLSSYQGSQHHQQSSSSPVPRVPSGGMYQSIPPYY